MVSLSTTTPLWLSLLTVSKASLAVGGVLGRAVALGVGVSTAVSALRRRLLVSPQASSSVSVPGISSVSQLSSPSGFAWRSLWRLRRVGLLAAWLVVALGGPLAAPFAWCGGGLRSCSRRHTKATESATSSSSMSSMVSASEDGTCVVSPMLA